MDMLVTTPQSEIDTSRKEGEIVGEEGGFWFRTFRFKPKVEIGEKIFFVEAGLIKGYGIVFEVSSTEGEECEVTGRTWKGNWVVKYNNWHWLKSPVPFKGFQGIRYVERLPQLKSLLPLDVNTKEDGIPPTNELVGILPKRL